MKFLSHSKLQMACVGAGSRVLTHFPPADTYNCGADVASVVRNEKNHKQKVRSHEFYSAHLFV